MWSLGDLLVCNSAHVGHALDDILEKACDQSPAVEAVVPLLQVCGQVLGADSMESAVDPGLEVAELKMDQGQDHAGVLGLSLNYGLMLEALARAVLSGPAIGEHVGPWGETGLDKGAEVGGASCRC